MDSEQKVCILPVSNSHTDWCVVDPIDWEWAKEYTWSAIGKMRYAARSATRDGRWITLYLHKEIAKQMYGAEAVNGKQVDHKDRCVWNNSRQNLRLATPKENARNRSKRRNNSSGVPGVSWHKRDKKWRVTIAGKHVRYYTTQKAAVEARKKAERKNRGDLRPSNDI